MSLSGEQALIFFKCEPDWHFETEVLNNAAIQLTAWRALVSPKPVKKKNRQAILYILAAVFISSGTFGLITFVGQSAR
jgi:hypothetical protein